MPAATRTIQLAGRLVIPGINDAHVHEPGLIDPGFIKDATNAPGDFDTITTTALLEAIEQLTHKHPAGTWLHGELGDKVIDDPALTLAALDHVAPDHPVWVDNFAGHVLFLNSAALRLLQIDPAAPVRGGFVGRDASGAGDGWLYEAARFTAKRKLASASSDPAIASAIRKFEDEALAFGITSVQTIPLELDASRLERVLRAHQPALRWHVMRFPIGEI